MEQTGLFVPFVRFCPVLFRFSAEQRELFCFVPFLSGTAVLFRFVLFRFEVLIRISRLRQLVLYITSLLPAALLAELAIRRVGFLSTFDSVRVPRTLACASLLLGSDLG